METRTGKEVNAMNAYDHQQDFGGVVGTEEQIGSVLIQAVLGEKPFLGLLPEGTYQGRFENDGLSVNRPDRGWISQPLRGYPSWHQAWDDNQIEIWLLWPEGWRKVEAWAEIDLWLSSVPPT